eukprot:g66419.t1
MHGWKDVGRDLFFGLAGERVEDVRCVLLQHAVIALVVSSVDEEKSVSLAARADLLLESNHRVRRLGGTFQTGHCASGLDHADHRELLGLQGWSRGNRTGPAEILLLGVIGRISAAAPGQHGLHHPPQPENPGLLFDTDLRLVGIWVRYPSVLLAQPFQVGDRVRLPGLGPMWQKYWVDRINIMNTLMRDFYGEIHVYPNSLLASQEIINLSRTPHCNVEIILDVSFDTPKAKLKQLFERITSFLKHKRLHWKPKFGMYVYGVSQATTLTLGLWLAHRLNSSSDIVFEDKSEAMDFIRNSMIEVTRSYSDSHTFTCPSYLSDEDLTRCMRVP